MPRDPSRAARLYCHAARQLNADAQFSLGWMYANGRGVPRDDLSVSGYWRRGDDEEAFRVFKQSERAAAG